MNKFIVETLIWIALNGARSAQAKQVLTLIAGHFGLMKAWTEVTEHTAWFGLKKWESAKVHSKPDYAKLAQADLDLRELMPEFAKLCQQPSAVDFAVAKLEGYKIENNGFYYVLLFSDVQSSFWRNEAAAILESTGFDHIQEMSGSDKAIDRAILLNGYLRALTGTDIPLARQPNAVGVWEDVTVDNLDSYLAWRCKGLIESQAKRAENNRTMH